MARAGPERTVFEPEEAALVRALRAGDEAAFDRFAEDYLPPLYRFAHRRLGDRELTRDIVQSTACKAIAGLDSFRGEARLSTWLFAICRNEIAAHHRHRSREGTSVELDEASAAASPAAGADDAAPGSPEAGLLRRERTALVHEALDALPPRYGRALEWMYLERIPVAEIAVRMGVGTKAAESLLTRARDAFRHVYLRLAGLPRPGPTEAGAEPARSVT